GRAAALLPRFRPTSSAAAAAQRRASAPRRRPRVAVLAGCVESVLAPRIHAAALRLLDAAGAEPLSVSGCCGALVHHLGRERQNRALATRLIDALYADIERGRIDAIVSHASGCGTHVKDYRYLFRSESKLAPVAAAVAERTRDISELLVELGLPERPQPMGIDVVYHSACSMQHGQKVHTQPRALLERAGFKVSDI